MFLKNLIFSVTILALFFAGSELVLSMAGVQPALSTEDPFVGFAGNIPLFVEEERGDALPVLRTADNKIALFNQQEFPKAKDADTYRIFCMGGSTTYGRPYRDPVSFCGWLRAYLKAADPGRDWQVINAGGISYASYRVAKLMTELLQYQPDLFIVYTGQNEFLEQRSYGGLIDLPDWLLDLNASLSGTRIYSVMSSIIGAAKPGSPDQAMQRAELSSEVDEVLNHTIGPQSYSRNETLRQQIMTHFRLNLGRMVTIARNAGAGILFVQPAINLKDMSPFKSEHRSGLDEQEREQWQMLYERATGLAENGNHREALDAYRQAMAIDDRHAELHYRTGKIHFRLGQYHEAEKAFRTAVEEDIAPLRVLGPMQRSIAEISESQDVPLIDFPHILREAYQDRYEHSVFGREFFVDHVHTNLEGYRLLGLALLDELVRQGIARPEPSWNQVRIATVTQGVVTGLDPGDEGHALLNLGKVLEWAGKFEEAYPLFQRTLEILGPSPALYDRLARTAYGLGLRDDAMDYLDRILSLAPASRGVHAKLAVILAEQGETERAISHFRTELLLVPGDYIVRARLGELLEKQGDDVAALEQYRKALQIKPDLARAHLKVAYLLLRQEHHTEALKHGREALQINPGLHRAHYAIALIMQRQGRPEEAAHHFSEALRLESAHKGTQKLSKHSKTSHDRQDASLTSRNNDS